MTTYRDLFFILFRGMRDATELLEKGSVFMAKDKLIAAQEEAEEAFLEGEVKNPIQNYSAMSFFLSCGLESALDLLEDDDLKAAKTALQDALDDAKRVDRGKKYPGFMRSMIPYSKEEVDALCGRTPMTQEMFESIMEEARNWDYTNVQLAMSKRYPQFIEQYDDKVGYPHSEVPW